MLTPEHTDYIILVTYFKLTLLKLPCPTAASNFCRWKTGRLSRAYYHQHLPGTLCNISQGIFNNARKVSSPQNIKLNIEESFSLCRFHRCCLGFFSDPFYVNNSLFYFQGMPERMRVNMCVYTSPLICQCVKNSAGIGYVPHYLKCSWFQIIQLEIALQLQVGKAAAGAASHTSRPLSGPLNTRSYIPYFALFMPPELMLLYN